MVAFMREERSALNDTLGEVRAGVEGFNTTARSAMDNSAKARHEAQLAYDDIAQLRNESARYAKDAVAELITERDASSIDAAVEQAIRRGIDSGLLAPGPLLASSTEAS